MFVGKHIQRQTEMCDHLLPVVFWVVDRSLGRIRCLIQRGTMVPGNGVFQLNDKDEVDLL